MDGSSEKTASRSTVRSGHLERAPFQLFLHPDTQRPCLNVTLGANGNDAVLEREFLAWLAFGHTISVERTPTGWSLRELAEPEESHTWATHLAMSPVFTSATK